MTEIMLTATAVVPVVRRNAILDLHVWILIPASGAAELRGTHVFWRGFLPRMFAVLLPGAVITRLRTWNNAMTAIYKTTTVVPRFVKPSFAGMGPPSRDSVKNAMMAILPVATVVLPPVKQNGAATVLSRGMNNVTMETT